MELVRQKITNSTLVPSIEREVIITGIWVDVLEPRLELMYHVEYFNENGEDVTSVFKSVGPRWIVDNSYRVTVVDESGNPIPNPDYGHGSDEPFIMEDAFDYFIQIAFKAEKPLRIEDLMKVYIIRDDIHKGRFNF